MIEVFDWGSKPPKQIAFCDSDDAIERLTKQGFDVWLKRKDLTVMVSFESEIEDYLLQKPAKDS